MKRIATRELWKRAALAGLAVASSLMATRDCAAEVQRYRISPGGTYTYLPSPWLPIPGGEPSPSELEFGVSGTFSMEYDVTSARLLDVNLELSGNEMVQEDPPHPITPVTADLVAEWLEDRMLLALAQIPEGPPGRVYADEQHPGFLLTDHLDRTVTLEGGFNSTPADGTGRLFEISGVAIPEPSTLALALLAAGGIVALRRRLW